MLERNASVKNELAPPGATPTLDKQPRRLADFATIGDALDYAANGNRGLNFHDARGALTQAYSYAELREDALARAKRFVALGIKPDDRIALVAETGPDFAACFFGAVYAGAWPVPLPLPTSFGGREAYIDQLGVQLKSCDPALLLYPLELADFCAEAGRKAAVVSRDWESLANVEPVDSDLPSAEPEDIAYLQYSSGSTRFPHGVAVTHRALLDNLRSHGVGLEVIASDRVISWLPWYHDMGLVGSFSPHRNADVGRLSEDRGFRSPAARLARHDYPQSRNVTELFADLRLRHLLAADELADTRQGSVRPVALAHRR